MSVATSAASSRRAAAWWSDYGIVGVFVALCAVLSLATWGEQRPEGAFAAREVARQIVEHGGQGARVAIVGRASSDDQAFADELEKLLTEQNFTVVEKVVGEPAAARRALAARLAKGDAIELVAASHGTAAWTMYSRLADEYPAFGAARLVRPPTYRGSSFLRPDNLLNIANQIAVIAILAIGMTMVIITGGIDLSVGRLIALSSVVTAVLMRDLAGGLEASSLAMFACGLAGIACCAAVGAFSGFSVARFGMPPFIVTLAVMLVADGMAYNLSHHESIDRIPESFMWLGRGADLLHIPNAVLLMLALYAAAHVVMTRTALGRYIYAIGGNAEAARLSGVPVATVLVVVYTLCGALAGLGGVVMASLFKSGAPTYGDMYELYVIAAVVVGGTSLSGGEGRIFHTLIGAFIIAVTQNGMNQLGVDSEMQKVVLGAVIYFAVLIDRLKPK